MSEEILLQPSFDKLIKRRVIAVTKQANILNNYELKAIVMSDKFDFNNFYKYELGKMINILKEENKQLMQLNKVVYVDKSEKILNELEKWLEEEKQLNGDVTMKISEVSIAILKKIKELKGE